ncbi:MAG: hypothetical protein PHS17_02905 [Desulfobacterales bacterium]|nr:hypothetical protein [Desulfobacterales bacterium]
MNRGLKKGQMHGIWSDGVLEWLGKERKNPSSKLEESSITPVLQYSRIFGSAGELS